MPKSKDSKPITNTFSFLEEDIPGIDRVKICTTVEQDGSAYAELTVFGTMGKVCVPISDKHLEEVGLMLINAARLSKRFSMEKASK